MAIQVTYRRTRRLSMRIVKNGDVHVSAPIGVSKKQVEAFIEENRGWIVEARLRLSEVEPMDSAVLAVEGIHLKGSISAASRAEASARSSKTCSEEAGLRAAVRLKDVRPDRATVR